MKITHSKKEKYSFLEKSFFLKYINRFTRWFYVLLINGFFGRLFTSYSSQERIFQNSYVAQKIESMRAVGKIKTKLRLGIAKGFENSRIITSCSDFLGSLLRSGLREYGLFFTVSGLLGLPVYLLNGGFVFTKSTFTLVSFLVVGIAFLTSKKTVDEAIAQSKILSLFLFDGLGIQKDALVFGSPKSRGYILPVLFGVFFGGLSYLVDPVYYAVSMAALLGISLVVYMPEIGVLSFFAAVPLAVYMPRPSVFLACLVGVTYFSYIVKLIRGKRVFKFRYLDFAVLVFIVVRLTSGLFGAGGMASFSQAVLHSVLLLSYFLAVNLIRSREWLKRAVMSFAAFALVSVLVGVFQVFAGGFESGWLDSSAFSEISVRITSTFENPNTYGAYLLLVIPFLVSALLESKSYKSMAIWGSALVLTLFCMVQTWSRGAWIGLAVSLVLYFLMTSRGFCPAILAMGGVASLGISIFAPNMVKRITSITDLSESSVSYRISAWKGILQMLRSNWWGGIGYGEAAFSAVYPAFAYSGAGAVKHAHSLYLQIVTESGVVGLVAFAFVLFLFSGHSFEYLYKTKESEQRSVVIAGLSAVAGVLIMGLTDYVWYNSRVFMAFWLVIALGTACVRIGFAERERLTDLKKNTDFSADVEIDPDSI